METNPIIKDDLFKISSVNLPWNKLRNKKILITGGGGFLPSYLVKSLLFLGQLHNLNLNVICMARSQESVNYRLSTNIDDDSFSLLIHDVNQALPKDMPRVDFIIHSASQASPKYYGKDPVGTLLTNSVGTANLLDYAVKNGVERFMFFSSGEVYGIPLNYDEMIEESKYGYVDPMNVRSCYAESKRIGETMCVAWDRQYDLSTCVVRPFHTYGPGLAVDDGRVFADFVADVVAGRDIVLKSDGSAMRPFCYIADATIGFLTVLLKGDRAEAYNIGNPKAEISIKDLAHLLQKLFPHRCVNVKSEVLQNESGYLKSPISRSCPSISKMQSLGWEPKVGLEEGFYRTIQSYL